MSNKTKNERLWIRLGDNAEYEDYGQDFECLADCIFEVITAFDDDLDLTDYMESYLRRKGYSVNCQHTLKSGMKEANSNPYEICFLDVSLPDGNGLSFLSE